MLVLNGITWLSLLYWKVWHCMFLYHRREIQVFTAKFIISLSRQTIFRQYRILSEEVGMQETSARRFLFWWWTFLYTQTISYKPVLQERISNCLFKWNIRHATDQKELKLTLNYIYPHEMEIAASSKSIPFWQLEIEERTYIFLLGKMIFFKAYSFSLKFYINPSILLVFSKLILGDKM